MNRNTDYSLLTQALEALTDGIPYESAILPMRQHCCGNTWRISTGQAFTR